jgi:protein SSD1
LHHFKFQAFQGQLLLNLFMFDFAVTQVFLPSRTTHDIYLGYNYKQQDFISICNHCAHKRVTDIMTDEATPQPHPPMKDEKKLSVSANTRGSKRPSSNSPNLRGGAPGARSASRGSNKKAPVSPAVESGSDTASRKGSESGKPQELRIKNPGGRGQFHRKAQPSAQGARNTKDTVSEQSSSPPPAQNKDLSDALSSLQRVIADLKSTSPVQQPIGANSPPSMPTAHVQSNLASHAPVFQPGAAAYPGPDQKHRKAVSLGVSNSSFNSFSPHLGAMMEDAEDIGVFEEGEIQERQYLQQGQHQPRSQSQSFMAPRFAALAAQQEQDLGPTGRPQLAPGFMFGARKRSSGPMGPPINEEDIGFQFPQQGQQGFAPEVSQQEQTHKRSESGEITGIMAEQVSIILWIVLHHLKDMLDRYPESDRGFTATATGLVSTTTCVQPGSFFSDAWSSLEPSCT